MYNEFSVWVNPEENWLEVHQWDNDDESREAIDRHFTTADRMSTDEAAAILGELGFTRRGPWRDSWARPGQWHALLNRIEVQR